MGRRPCAGLHMVDTEGLLGPYGVQQDVAASGLLSYGDSA